MQFIRLLCNCHFFKWLSPGEHVHHPWSTFYNHCLHPVKKSVKKVQTNGRIPEILLISCKSRYGQSVVCLQFFHMATVIPVATNDFWHTSQIRLCPPLQQFKAFEGVMVVVVVRFQGGFQFNIICWGFSIILRENMEFKF